MIRDMEELMAQPTDERLDQLIVDIEAGTEARQEHSPEDQAEISTLRSVESERRARRAAQEARLERLAPDDALVAQLRAQRPLTADQVERSVRWLLDRVLNEGDR